MLAVINTTSYFNNSSSSATHFCFDYKKCNQLINKNKNA